MSNQTKNNNLNYLIDPTFTNVDKLFVLSFENEDQKLKLKTLMYQLIESHFLKFR